jgi:3-methyladenine DNA glycosylase AlkD
MQTKVSSLYVKKELRDLADEKKALILQRFFKTGKGEYGEGDLFLGISVPVQRLVAKKYQDLSLLELQKLICSRVHEHRLTALIILVNKFKKENKQVEKRKIVDFYLNNRKWINNWDLVDASASYILGEWLHDKEKDILYKLVLSKNVWDRRVSMIATLAFIKRNEFKDTLKLAEILIGDEHDLIHKASGWMLREIGKRSVGDLEEFLFRHYKEMPRTMLRYSIERLPENKRKYYLHKG